MWSTPPSGKHCMRRPSGERAGQGRTGDACIGADGFYVGVGRRRQEQADVRVLQQLEVDQGADELRR